MKPVRLCEHCHGELPGDAPEGLCPKCLVRIGGAELGIAVRHQEARGSGHEPEFEPRAFGEYELLERIGQGGMGTVYKARQLNLDRLVALKLLPLGTSSGPGLVQRFRTEASAAAALQHPNIVAVHDVGEHEGKPFFSMDYVEGSTLAELVRDQALPAKRAATYLQTIAEAVHYAHQQGIIHRDLKPSNVLIDAFDQPRITDFGLAKRLHGDSDLTLTGQVLGSPNFISPEQAEGRSQAVGPASDVYSLGALLYHLLTRQPPFQADTLTTLLKLVVEVEPLPPRALNPSIPKDLETICLKCLEKEPARRYPTAQRLAEDLARFLRSEPILARPVSPAGKAWKWCRRQPVRAALITALGLALVFGLVGVSWQWQRAERERSMALRHAYAGDMKVALLSLEEGNLGGALRLLDKYRPEGKAKSKRLEGGTDLRGWEWRYLWGLSQSDERFKLTQHTNGFVNLALFPDGKLLAVQQAGGNIDLWNWEARQYEGTLTNQGYPPAMALSADGKLIAAANQSGSGQDVISFWDVRTRRIIRNVPQSSRVTSLAFSPDGKLLAAFHTRPMCSLWRVSAGEWVTNYPAGPSLNLDMRIPMFSPDGSQLMLGDWGGLYSVIRCINLRTGSVRETRAGIERNAITALALSPDGQTLACGYGPTDAIIELWDLPTFARVGRLKGHRGWVKKLAFSTDGRTLYSGSADETVRAWSITDRKESNRWKGHSGMVTGLALAPGDSTVLTCAVDGSVRVWDTQGSVRPPAYLVLPVKGTPYCAPFTKDSRRLITASATDPVTVWEAKSGRVIEQIPALGTNHLSVALSPDEHWLVTGSINGLIQIWDMRQRTIVSRFQANSNGVPIYVLRFLARDSSLLTFAIVPHQSCEFKRWEAGTWREIPSQIGEAADCCGFAVSSDGQHLAVSSETEPLKLWDLASGRLEGTFQFVRTMASVPAFSSDRRLLAVPLGDHTWVWDLGSRRLIGSLEQQVSKMISAAFSPEGGRLVTGLSVAGELQPALEIWDYVSERGLLSLRTQGTFLHWTEFSPDGNTLLALDFFGQTELWHAPSWADIKAAEKPEEMVQPANTDRDLSGFSRAIPEKVPIP